MSDKLASQFEVGEKDEADNILIRENWPLQLWKTPKDWYVINLWINERDSQFLWTLRKDPDDADELFDAMHNMLK